MPADNKQVVQEMIDAPTGDELRAIIKSVGSLGTNHDDAPMEYVLAGWRAALAKAAPIAVPQPNVLPQAVLDALRFYAHGHHFNIDADHQQFDTVSGEPQNWLMSEKENDCTMIEDGSIAKAVLLGGLPGFEEPTEPLEGEVFAAFDLSQQFVDKAASSDDGDFTVCTPAPAPIAPPQPVYDTSVVKRIATQMGWTPPRDPALQRYTECMKGENEPDAVERLRFFCSLAMNGQDWIDVEPFFDAVTKGRAPVASEAQIAWMWRDGGAWELSFVPDDGSKPAGATACIAPYLHPAKSSAEMLTDAERGVAINELRNIAQAKRFDRERFECDVEFADWAQSRARHALAEIERIDRASSTTASDKEGATGSDAECRIWEYDGAFKCMTHQNQWGAIGKPVIKDQNAPCAVQCKDQP